MRLFQLFKRLRSQPDKTPSDSAASSIKSFSYEKEYSKLELNQKDHPIGTVFNTKDPKVADPVTVADWSDGLRCRALGVWDPSVALLYDRKGVPFRFEEGTEIEKIIEVNRPNIQNMYPQGTVLRINGVLGTKYLHDIEVVVGPYHREDNNHPNLIGLRRKRNTDLQEIVFRGEDVFTLFDLNKVEILDVVRFEEKKMEPGRINPDDHKVGDILTVLTENSKSERYDAVVVRWVESDTLGSQPDRVFLFNLETGRQCLFAASSVHVLKKLSPKRLNPDEHPEGTTLLIRGVYEGEFVHYTLVFIKDWIGTSTSWNKVSLMTVDGEPFGISFDSHPYLVFDVDKVEVLEIVEQKLDETLLINPEEYPIGTKLLIRDLGEEDQSPKTVFVLNWKEWLVDRTYLLKATLGGDYHPEPILREPKEIAVISKLDFQHPDFDNSPPGTLLRVNMVWAGRFFKDAVIEVKQWSEPVGMLSPEDAKRTSILIDVLRYAGEDTRNNMYQNISVKADHVEVLVNLGLTEWENHQSLEESLDKTRKVSYLNPVEHPVGTRLVLRVDDNTSREAIVYEWSPYQGEPTKARLFLDAINGHENTRCFHWFEVTTKQVVIRVIPTAHLQPEIHPVDSVLFVTWVTHQMKLEEAEVIITKWTESRTNESGKNYTVGFRRLKDGYNKPEQHQDARLVYVKIRSARDSIDVGAATAAPDTNSDEARLLKKIKKAKKLAKKLGLTMTVSLGL